MIIRFFSVILAFVVLSGASFAAAQDKAVPENSAQIQLSFAPVVKQVAPAVVNIYTKRTVSRRVASPFANDPFFAPFFGRGGFGGRMKKQVESSLGSGVILQPNGLVMTNAHVAKGAQEITVGLLDGREFDADIALLDEASDLAVLKMRLEGDQALPHAKLKASEGLEVGDIVLAIGNPFGVGQTVTSGIVSAQGRSSLNINDFNFFIQTDAAINPGNSGGPLVTLDGQVVGINTAIYSRDGGSLGIGFAVPSEMVASVIAAEAQGRTGEQGVLRPWMGVSAQIVTADIASSLDLDRPAGVLIAQLHEASPLRKAGIKVGDVMLRMNDREIRDPAEMKFRMATVPLGSTATVVVARKGTERIYEVEAIQPPEVPKRDETHLEGAHIFDGVSIANINPALAIEMSLEEEDGVVVTDIPRGSAAARFLRTGSLIVEFNGKEIEDVKDMKRALKSFSGAPFSLSVKSAGRVRTITVR